MNKTVLRCVKNKTEYRVTHTQHASIEDPDRKPYENLMIEKRVPSGYNIIAIVNGQTHDQINTAFEVFVQLNNISKNNISVIN